MTKPHDIRKRYRGVAHAHSTYSFDGKLTLQDLIRFFRDRNLDFVLMSEHVESLDPDKVRSFIEDCARYSSSEFLAVPGIEIDALNALYYDVQPVTAWKDEEDLARQLVSAGAMAVVSHPVKVHGELPAVTAELVEGVEVWNSRHDGKLAPDGKILRFWRVLRQRINRQLLPMCGIDFHKPDDFIPLVFDLQCDSLERHQVMAAIRGGRYTIRRGDSPVPLDFTSGNLAVAYRLYTQLYRLIYRTIYQAHRVVQSGGLRAPRPLRRILRRMF